MTTPIASPSTFIELRNATLRYPTRPLQRRSIKADMVRIIGARRLGSRLDVEHVIALENVSLSIGPGERVGLVGRNGAGKSSFLRLVAGIYLPDFGDVIVKGNVQGIFDIGIGFETDATGRANILYRGLVLGMHPDHIRARTDEIIAFTDLGEFIDMPLRAYSSGMVVRLAFAISTFLQGDILLIDEIFGTGDLAFYNKAKLRMQSLVANAHIVCFASHDLGTLREICTRALWIDRGIIRMDGPVKDVTDSYEKAVLSGQI
jgi:lipopolysaccharide transport system ATP-binding protein